MSQIIIDPNMLIKGNQPTGYNIIERVHLLFLKHILNLKNSTLNFMLYGTYIAWWPYTIQ
jgi:hypothetical protein